MRRRISADGIVLLWLYSPYVCSHGFELLGACFTPGSCEYVFSGNHFHFPQAGIVDSVQVLSFQESAADSSCPEVHFCLGAVGDRFVDHHVSQIQSATGLQDSENL